MSFLSVITVNYRSGLILSECLDSFFRIDPPSDFEVIVINNDLASDLAPVQNRKWPSTSFIQNRANLGFAAAVNLGLGRSQGEFVLLLNPDIIVQRGSIQSLLDTMGYHAKAGIVMPLLRNPDGSLQYSCRRFYTYPTLLLRRAPLRWMSPNHPLVQQHLMLDWKHDSLAEVDWGLGAAMLIRRAAIEDCGLFDERFFLYFEDVDLCVRMWRRGWSVFYNPESTMVHSHRRDSARSWFHPAKRHHTLSLLKFIRKYQGNLGKRCRVRGQTE